MEITKANLATYLAGLTPNATPYPIEITETVASDWRNSNIAGTVGTIINTKTPSGVTINLGLTVIPNSVTAMLSAFRGCTSLTTAPIIPSSVTDMSSTFQGCTALTTAPIIPSSVTDMSYTFSYCTALTTAPVIPSSVTDMMATFYRCTALTTAPIIPNSVTDMSSTFYRCTALTTAPIIPNSVTKFGDAFFGCTSLHTIQNFAVDVDNCDMTRAFGSCPALANIYVTTLTESSWHLLHTDTGATGTNYTIYNPDGTVAGSGTVAGTSQVLTLYGKSDELVISANITPTLAVETATSQVQWHKSGLPYDDELMIFNAKNPDTVISNFITVNRAGEEFLGNATTATKLATARKINGVDFDGSANITVADSTKAPTSHASSATTYGVSSESNYGHAKASNVAPSANGTASKGTTPTVFAQSNHVHPLQTSVTGNAGTATKLATARKIHGVNFDGTADIYDTYSTTETRIGTWIDGKPLYRKVVNFGALPNNTLKTVAYNISNLGKTISLYGIAEAATIVIQLPYVAFTVTDSVNLRQEGNAFIVETRTDRTAYTALIFIEYTKTTD